MVTLVAAMKGMQVGLLMGNEGAEQDAFPRSIFNEAVVAEETIVLHIFKDVPCSSAILMGTICSVNLGVSTSHSQVFLWISTESGDEDQTRPSLWPSTRIKKQSPEEQIQRQIKTSVY